MKKTVELYGLNIEVTFDDSTANRYAAGETVYEETYITDDGRCIGFDEELNDYVQIWPEIPNDYPLIF